jgi:hypothetical protein
MVTITKNGAPAGISYSRSQDLGYYARTGVNMGMIVL